MSHARAFEVDRNSVDADAGTFRAVVFSDGEASDGHILSIRGGDVPETIPLFVNHEADPRSQLGSLHLEKKTAHEIVMRGEIFTEGDGAEADIRRDIMAKIAAGHVSRMSGRWDADEADVQRRTDLDTDHPAFVSDKKAKNDSRYRYGLHFGAWRALEGSVVGLGADKAATMRFAEEATSEPVREFWRSLAAPAEEPTDIAPEVEPEPEEASEETAPTVDALEAGFADREPETAPTGEPPDYRAAIQHLLDSDIDVVAIAEELQARDPFEVVRDEFREELASLRAEISTLRHTIEANQSEGVDPQSFLALVNKQTDEARSRTLEKVRAFVDQRRGKVTDDESRRDAAAELRALLQQ